MRSSESKFNPDSNYGKETILLKHNLDPLFPLDIATISILFYRLEQTQRNNSGDDVFGYSVDIIILAGFVSLNAVVSEKIQERLRNNIRIEDSMKFENSLFSKCFK